MNDNTSQMLWTCEIQTTDMRATNFTKFDWLNEWTYNGHTAVIMGSVVHNHKLCSTVLVRVTFANVAKEKANQSIKLIVFISALVYSTTKKKKRKQEEGIFHVNSCKQLKSISRNFDIRFIVCSRSGQNLNC